MLAESQALDELHDHEDCLSSLVHKGLDHPHDARVLQGLDQLVLLERNILVLVVHAPDNFDSELLIMDAVLRILFFLCYQIIF